MQTMEAEIVFDDPDKMKAGIAALDKRGFAIELVDFKRLGPTGGTACFKVRITTDIAEDRFLDWVASFIEPLGGDVVSAAPWK